ncbi:MAG: alpha-amylase family glycosyl hydrolase [Syntrophobacteraceae bacterium]
MRQYRKVDEILNHAPPRSIEEALCNWPKQERYHPSPGDWRNEILYFLLPDRFADENVNQENLLIRRDGDSARTSARTSHCGNWRNWCISGSSRFQGGTIRGITRQLGYLHELGTTAIWVGPVFRQRVEQDTYHGYGIQDFFDVDARFGTRGDLVELVREAHKLGMRIILDIIFNHSGTNWVYDPAETGGEIWEPCFRPCGYYETMLPLNGMGHMLPKGSDPRHHDDFVWPEDLRGDINYWKKGSANLAESDYTDPMAEHKVGDFCRLRDFNTDHDNTLFCLVTIYQYWIALTDCDGFRIDTVKHVSSDAARNWCNAVTEHADCLGKTNFLLLGEVAGGSKIQKYYTNEAYNLDATLDIGDIRLTLRGLGQGFESPRDFFVSFKEKWDDDMGSHRRWGDKHVSVLDDHDHVFGEKLRFSTNAPSEIQVVVPVAIQLFTLGIPCIYYGTEQALRGLPREEEQRGYITSITNDDGKPAYDVHKSDWLLREAMFGPKHPRKSGFAGVQGELDRSLPGFGVEGTSNSHVFDREHPAYRRIRALTAIRKRYLAATRGRQYPRDVSTDGGPFTMPQPGSLVAWSRIHDHNELLILVNTNGVAPQRGRVAVDPRFAGESYFILEDTERLEDSEVTAGRATLRVQREDNTHFIDCGQLQPSQVIVLGNHFIHA